MRGGQACLSMGRNSHPQSGGFLGRKECTSPTFPVADYVRDRFSWYPIALHCTGHTTSYISRNKISQVIKLVLLCEVSDGHVDAVEEGAGGGDHQEGHREDLQGAGGAEKVR